MLTRFKPNMSVAMTMALPVGALGLATYAFTPPILCILPCGVPWSSAPLRTAVSHHSSVCRPGPQ